MRIKVKPNDLEDKIALFAMDKVMQHGSDVAMSMVTLRRILDAAITVYCTQNPGILQTNLFLYEVCLGLFYKHHMRLFYSYNIESRIQP